MDAQYPGEGTSTGSVGHPFNFGPGGMTAVVKTSLKALVSR